jgi:glycosyltransferase involved in cell wall biosynthesis
LIVVVLGSMSGPPDGQRLLTRMFTRGTKMAAKLHDFNGFRKTPLRLVDHFLRACFRAAWHRPDVVYIAISRTRIGGLRDALLMLPYALRGVPIVAHVHGGDFADYYASRWRWIPTILQLRMIGHFIFVHEEYGSKFRGLLSIDVVRNPVPNFEVVNRIQSGRRLAIGFISSFSPGKGMEIFLDAACSHPHDFDWVLAGGVNERFRVYGQGVLDRIYSTPSVKYLGYLERPLEFFNQVDFLLFPSTYVSEALPGVVLEALATGCIPILKRTDRLELVFRDSTTMWFESEAELARILAECSRMSSEHREQRAMEGARWVRSAFPTPEEWVRRIDGILQERARYR